MHHRFEHFLRVRESEFMRHDAAHVDHTIGDGADGAQITVLPEIGA
jgi:hypothetical protein